MDNNEDKLDPEILDRIDAQENECAGCGEKHDNPYRHIEEANEENYKAVEKSNEENYKAVEKSNE